jgi:hypothetical protein
MDNRVGQRPVGFRRRFYLEISPRLESIFGVASDGENRQQQASETTALRNCIGFSFRWSSVNGDLHL